MRRKKISFSACPSTFIPASLLLVFSLLGLVQCQLQNLSPPQFSDPLAQTGLRNLTSEILSSRLAREYRFCIRNPDDEWNRAFNYQDSSFLTECLATTPDLPRRLCTAAEVEVYFGYIRTGSTPPNRNCNSSNWIFGCEAGLACSADSEEPVDLQESSTVPARGTQCSPCCEGFFCPNGLTCMLPCPQGAYCPRAEADGTGRCAPYNYRVPPSMRNYTCGAANVWSDASRSWDTFCPAGSYCPTTTQRIPCTSGNYCPMGSTEQTRCIRLTSCSENTANQNLRIYGAMLIAALSAILLVIYTCSDQIIATRERRASKSREAAIKTVRRKNQAVARWKAAKDSVKKNALKLHSQLSGRFLGRTPSTADDVPLKEIQKETGRDLYPIPSAVSQASTSESFPLSENERDEIDDNHYIDMTNAMKDEHHKKARKRLTKDKDINTESQIFKYAYSQLEKENAQMQGNKNATFSGVLAMATHHETRRRPPIEISFSDLTVTLKGKNKILLKSVTGKIRPGRITAIMGPSGAGKTTFLSALTGKTVGCRVNGTILINGESVSIHSYTKIIGFVPQDDIVHGNLTVEENLWFSAHCRLSADLPKKDKVLVVERVISSLGLQAVRGSIVGTVENRGISGGQRKRVNVGIEMVIEPSLLFLDEPTSGLDSTSSLLLLRALRREAIEGVNVCMVVHQPSYTLFQMFDDLVLLAKGGLTAYHGSAKRMEQYFSNLGIVVPERVNPPDHYIDILEGMVKEKSGTAVSYKELPVRWMLHNGYPIPPDMRSDVPDDALPTLDNGHYHSQDSVGSSNGEKSFLGEFLQDLKLNMETRRDIVKHKFLKSTDLSNRRTPNILTQYKYFLGRMTKQRLRDAKTQAVDYLILLIAGACLGTLERANNWTFGFAAYTYTVIAVSLLCKIASLRTFSLDKLQYWRESASGISSLAHFVAKDTVDIFNVLIKPVVYLSMFYFFSNPRSSFADNYIVLLCLVYCVTGIGYTLAIFLEPGPSQLLSVLLPVVLTLISTQAEPSRVVSAVSNICYPKWTLEAFVIANANRYHGVWLLTRCGVLQRFGYNVHNWGLCLLYLIIVGVVLRGTAFVGMLVLHKKK